jgi:hypothetical protein
MMIFGDGRRGGGGDTGAQINMVITQEKRSR